MREVPGEARVLLASLVGLHFVTDFYWLLLSPLLPVLIATFGLSYLQAGLFSFVALGISAVLQPLAGHWADLYRWRKAVIIVGLLSLSLAAVAIGVSQNYAMLFAAAVLLGIGASTYHPQATNLITIHFPRAKGLASGLHNVGSGLGFIAAPLAVGLLLTAIGWRGAAFVLALPGLVAAALAWAVIREPAVRSEQGFLGGVSRPFLLFMVIFGLGGMVFNSLLIFLPTFYVSRGWSLAAAGGLTALMVAPGIFSQPLAGAVSDIVGRRAVFVVVLLSLGAVLAGFVYSSGSLMLLLLVLFGLLGNLLTPIALVYAAEMAKGDRVGSTVGLLWGFSMVTSALGQPLVGSLADAAGFGVAFLVLAGVAVLAAALSTRLKS